MTSETRYFSPLGQSYTLSYDYNLAGELKKITDAAGMTINYGFDAIGRVNGVTGSDDLYAGVSNYESTFQYRAWNGLKTITDGTNHVTSLSYNARLLPTHFEISGNVVSQNYDYNASGHIGFLHNTTDASFDRSYAYDHAGRLIENRTGGQARGDTGAAPYYEIWDTILLATSPIVPVKRGMASLTIPISPPMLTIGAMVGAMILMDEIRR